jgi:guanylate kinase
MDGTAGGQADASPQTGAQARPRRGRRGIPFVMTRASGVGKDTIRQAALPGMGDLVYSISATTRAQRPGETDGVQYHFLTHDRFERLIEANGLLEYAEYVGDYYGTPRAPVERALADGRDVLLELELAGARQLKVALPEAVMVFIAPPSLYELERRLRGRGTDDEAKIQKRLARAREEIKAVREFDYAVGNDELDEAVRDFRAVIHAERVRAVRLDEHDVARFLRED